ncbi:hypothetical protein [Campylobacter sp. RM9328]|uniref:hypothetical protein n=1 Tax=Campylobacter sp. RM9328 TaxID=1705720 RepID=UPI001475F87F|nr:hypothetical protein [Campylobacter sp. RM9328]
MRNLNSYEYLIKMIIEANKDRDMLVIDPKFYKVRKFFFASKGFISHNTFIGSFFKRHEAWKTLESDFLKTNIPSFLSRFGYYPKKGNKYLLAIKENVLDLY